LGMFPRVTHPSATSPEGPVRLACVRPAASVHSEPGSNSQVESAEALSLTSNLRTSAPVFACKHKGLSVSCFGCRNNKSRKTVKLYQVIGSSARAKFPAGQICYVLDADAPKPPTYPFNSINVKERGHKTDNTPDIRAYLPSYIQIFCAKRFSFAPRFRPSASLRLFVFGEALSRESALDPQEEKSLLLLFSCYAQCLKGFFASAAEGLADAKSSLARFQALEPESALAIRPIQPNLTPS
jgi:hypothetical protein